MNTKTLIDQLPATASPTIAWDSTVYERLFTESPAEQLRNTPPITVISIALNQPEFVQNAIELADEEGVQLVDIIHSIYRTLIEANHRSFTLWANAIQNARED